MSVARRNVPLSNKSGDLNIAIPCSPITLNNCEFDIISKVVSGFHACKSVNMMFFPKAATLADFANQSGRWIRGSRTAMAYLYCDTFSAALKAYTSSTSIVLKALINCDDNDS